MPNDKTMAVPLTKTSEIFLKNIIIFCKRIINKGQVETNLNNIKNNIIRLYLKFISKHVFFETHLANCVFWNLLIRIYVCYLK